MSLLDDDPNATRRVAVATDTSSGSSALALAAIVAIGITEPTDGAASLVTFSVTPLISQVTPE